jgi:hypothetical protein
MNGIKTLCGKMHPGCEMNPETDNVHSLYLDGPLTHRIHATTIFVSNINELFPVVLWFGNICLQET